MSEERINVALSKITDDLHLSDFPYLFGYVERESVFIKSFLLDLKKIPIVMKTLITIFTIISLALSSCTLFLGYNYNITDAVKNLYIGMAKEDAISVMGNHYSIESVSEEEEGLLEIIKYSSDNTYPYLLHFLDGKLVVFEKYYPPYVPEQKIIVKQEKE